MKCSFIVTQATSEATFYGKWDASDKGKRNCTKSHIKASTRMERMLNTGNEVVTKRRSSTIQTNLSVS
jgi:hypothetical protein